jgi:adenine phosphoribosyltransferase
VFVGATDNHHVSGADEVEQARDAFLASFRWSAGHADVWPIFSTADTLSAVVRGLAAPFAQSGITAVAGVESRGFLLGGAVAVALEAGFVAVRKAGALFPGATMRQVTDAIDYRGRIYELRMRPDSLRPTDRVLLVDDWIETGSQARAVASMIAASGATLAGISVMVDQLDRAARPHLPPVTALVTSDQLPACAG